MNINTCNWDPALIKYFGVPLDALPEIRSSSEIYGQITRESLLKVPLAGIIGNRQASLLGHKCHRPGHAKAVWGSSGSLMANTGENKIYSKHGLITTIAFHFGHSSRPVYALEGPIASIGEGAQWVKKMFNSKSCECTVPGKADKNKQYVYFVPALRGK